MYCDHHTGETGDEIGLLARLHHLDPHEDLEQLALIYKTVATRSLKKLQEDRRKTQATQTKSTPPPTTIWAPPETAFFKSKTRTKTNKITPFLHGIAVFGGAPKLNGGNNNFLPQPSLVLDYGRALITRKFDMVRTLVKTF